MQFDEPEKIGKICRICGKLDMMNPHGLYCDACKKKRYNAKSLERYWKHREEILAKLHSGKKDTSKTYANHEKPRLFPVVFNCKDGRYSWQVNFKNPLTGNNVVWKSGGDFATLRDAQKDFSKACSGGK